MEFFEQLKYEISILDFSNLLIICILFYIPFHFSRKAQSYFFRIFFSVLGLYLIFTADDTRIIYDTKLTVGLGLFIPQIIFSIFFVNKTIETIKFMSRDTYFFFISVYYKLIRLVNWFKNIFINLKIFFANPSFKKENFESKSNNDYSKQEYEYKEENKTTNGHKKYERFYSNDPYVVLGVTESDSMADIKKAKRDLLQIYHPDKIMMTAPEKLEFYTVLTQNIMDAYDKIENIQN